MTSERWTKKKVLITVRTYPVPAQKGVEVSCTAGITDDGNCPRCRGMLQLVEDPFGGYLRCFMGCWQLDLLQPPPEHLALLMKVATHNHQGQGHHGGRIGVPYNVAGIRQKSGKPEPKYRRKPVPAPYGGRPPEYQDDAED